MFSVIKYNPRSWFWIVSGDIGQIFSSEKGALVPMSDSVYRAWVDAGNRPTAIPSYSDLYEVLAQQAPDAAARAAPAFARGGFLTPQQRFLFSLDAGVRVESASDPSINGEYGIAPLDLDRLERLSGGPETAMGLVDRAGLVHRLSAGQLREIFSVVRDYITALHIAESVALAGGDAVWPEPLVKIR